MTTLALTLSSGNLRAMLQESHQQAGACCDDQAGQITWSLHHPVGEWQSQGVALRPGLDLLMTRATLHERFRCVQTLENLSMWGLRFCLMGQARLHIRPGNLDILTCSGMNTLMRMTGAMIVATDYPADQPIELVTVALHPDVVQTLMPSLSTAFNPESGERLQTANLELATTTGQTTPAMTAILRKILNCPYQGDLQRLYLEAQVLQLLVLKFEQVQQLDAQPSHGFRLKPEDIERIHRARDILLANLEQPPSLIALARQVGINDFKLKRGFRQIFGTTVFGLLHQYRMEQGRLLLEANRLSVAHVAQTVGYASPSQFSAAFKKTFGLSPKAYKASCE